jgi:hypothetical protein
MSEQRQGRRARRLVAALLAGAMLTFAGCSAEGSVDTEGDGVQIDGDVDVNE